MAISSVVTNVGRAMFADRIRPSPSLYSTAPVYIAMGVGATAANHTAAVSDLGLITEVETRILGIDSLQTTSVQSDTFQLTGTWIANSGARAVDEAGIFDGVSGGHMFTSATFNAVNLNQLDSIVVTWRIQLA